MDLFCPHCTRRVTVPDDKAGQIVNCPLCAKQFMTPSLAPANPIVSKPVAPPMLTPTLPSITLPPTSSPTAIPQPPRPKLSVPIPAPAPPSPPPPPGDYTRSYTVHLHGQWLPFVPPACLVLIFFLSFSSWELPDGLNKPMSMWELSSFSKPGKPMFLAYALLLLLCILLASASLAFEKRLGCHAAAAPTIHPVERFDRWTFSDYRLHAAGTRVSRRAPQLPHKSRSWLAMKLAFRLHFLAMLASLLMFWLHWRKLSNAPPPKCELRW